MFGIIVIILLVVVIIFLIVTTITGKKAKKNEIKQRKKVVRDEIKNYIFQEEKRKNLRINFEQVFARKGPDYKYRDVFDVIVDIVEPKTNQVTEVKAYEIEGFPVRIDKKNTRIEWTVNREIDIEETRRRIAIAEKQIKLSKEEKKALKQEEVSMMKEKREKERLEYKEIKQKQKEEKKVVTPVVDDKLKKSTVKFVPKRNK
ncbi:hypothetical protein [Spiroplasma alleghenense]|uniref:Uncharacterized protein n=1 Tax=Spiroplasma alleghenense TaxID=216931 RepID=A0A345Z3A2_9MOLU|nr:hypothetical protein [Spiroplasma alleghenense]AXK51081.1 hypothetical protein SALLE_v1c04070 [Spiroplasma alleghenense]